MKEKNENGFMESENIDETSVNPEVSLINIPARGIDIERELESIEKNIELFNRIKLVALKLTKTQDWVDQSGNPYLMDRGAENVAIAFGVDISDVSIKMEWNEDNKGRYYSFTATGKAYSKKLGRYVEDIGVCSQRDKFFGYDSRKREYRPIEDVDMANIKRKAVTNLFNRLIKRVIGLMNVTMDDLKQAGVDISKIGKIDYSKEKEVSESGKEIRKKLGDILLEMASGDKEIAAEYLKKYSIWKTDEGKDVFATSLKTMSDKWLASTYGKAKKDYEKTQYSGGEQQELEDEAS
jgi:hypothetical protein